MSGRPVGATALLLRGQARPDRCFGTSVGASALLLVLRHSCWCFGTLAGATNLLLHGQPRFDRWLGTPAGATALLLRGQARPDRCLGTPAGATTPQYCIVPSGNYCIASYSFLMIGLGSQTVI